MTTASVTFALITSFALTAAQDAEPLSLKKYKSEDGNFSIELPGVPKAQRVPVNPENEKGAKQVQYVYGVDDGAYLVSYQDNPNLEEADEKAQAEALKTAQESLGKTFGKLLSEKPIKLLDKYPGREFEYEIPGQKGRYRSRMYMVDGRLYQVIVVGAEAFASSKTAEAVLDSFALLR
jgi:hypothetical protein